MFRRFLALLIAIVVTLVPVSQSQMMMPNSTITPRTTTTATRQSTGTPQDTTAKAGDDVTFDCTGDFVEWSVYTPSVTVIFDSRDPSGNVANPTKYSVTQQKSLVVSNVQNSDGTTYQCKNAYSGTSLHLANLVVIDENTLVAAVDPSTVLTAGTVANFTCSVTYGAPTTDPAAVTKPLDVNQNPKLTIHLDDTEVQGVEYFTAPETVMGQRTKIATATHTVVATDGGKALKCTVTSVASSQTFTYSEAQTLNMHYAPNRLNTSIESGATSVAAGTIITCDSNGNPPPTVQWISQTDGLTGPTPENGRARLTVSANVQQQKWTCMASNTQGNTSKTISFTVAGATEPEGNTDDTSDKRKVAVGVGIGIGLGIPVLIAIIVLVVILMRRKRSSGGMSPAVKTTKAPPPNESGKPPINEINRPQRPVSNNRNGPTINPNPNPMYMPPVYPEQVGGTGAVPPKRTPDRPGYGDLGVGHINAGGSTPSLNRSYESSKAGDDYPPPGLGHVGPCTSEV